MVQSLNLEFPCILICQKLRSLWWTIAAVYPIFPIPGSVAFRPRGALFPSPKKSMKVSKGAITGIAVGSSLVAWLLLLLLLLLCLGKRRRSQPAKPVAVTRAAQAEVGTSSSKDDITGGSVEAERNKLVFFEGGIHSFDLEDLLRASVDVLGKRSFRTSYGRLNVAVSLRQVWYIPRTSRYWMLLDKTSSP